MNKMAWVSGVMAFGMAFAAVAKLPPAPPPDPAKVAEKAEKDKAAAEKTKADLSRYEDKAVANFQANMKKQGKPVPKPTIIATAVTASAPAKSTSSAGKK